MLFSCAGQPKLGRVGGRGNAPQGPKNLVQGGQNMFARGPPKGGRVGGRGNAPQGPKNLVEGSKICLPGAFPGVKGWGGGEMPRRDQQFILDFFVDDADDVDVDVDDVDDVGR